VTLKKAKKKLITQRAAAEELGLSTRQVKRLLYAMKKRGDKAVIHGLRGKPSKRKIEASIQQQAVKILSAEVYGGFGPTLAAEYLRKKHGIEASKETVRQWMIEGKLWRAKAEKVEQVHVWRPRRGRAGGGGAGRRGGGGGGGLGGGAGGGGEGAGGGGPPQRARLAGRAGREAV